MPAKNISAAAKDKHPEWLMQAMFLELQDYFREKYDEELICCPDSPLLRLIPKREIAIDHQVEVQYRVRFVEVRLPPE